MNDLPLTSAKNPILWREMIYQRRTTPPRLVRYETRIMIVLVGVMLALTMIVLLNQGVDDAPELLLLLALWLLHLSMAVRFVISGAGVISREHLSGSWESLILTGISKRKIFFGKWRVVVRRVWKWGIVYVVLWMGVIFALIFGRVRIAEGYHYDNWTITAIIPALYIVLTLTNRGWHPVGSRVAKVGLALAVLWIGAALWPYGDALYRNAESVRSINGWMLFVVSPLLCIIFAVLEILSCTALGIAASAITRRGAIAALVGSTIRVMPSLLMGLAFIGVIIGDIPSDNDYLVAFMFGIGEPSFLITILNQTGQSELTYLIVGIVVGIIFLAAILIFSLIAGFIALNRAEPQPR